MFIRHLFRQNPLTIAVALLGLASGAQAAETITLISDRDNTLIESALSNVSAGSAYHFYAGRVGTNDGGSIRRGLLRFDVAGALPRGATILSATLTLHCAQSGGGGSVYFVNLHRLLADWGEENSFAFGGGGTFALPGDATWLHRFYPTVFWASPGGDFVGAVSGTTNVGASAFYSWPSTPLMVEDVQTWLDDPASNFGWILRGNESVLQTVKKFDTHESPARANHPRLAITYEVPSGNAADLDGDGLVTGSDLGLLLQLWGSRGPVGDLNEDGIVDGSDLGLLLQAWS